MILCNFSHKIFARNKKLINKNHVNGPVLRPRANHKIHRNHIPKITIKVELPQKNPSYNDATSYICTKQKEVF